MSEQTVAENIKFNLELMCFMLECGRDDEANNSLYKAMQSVEKLIDEGK
jgi:aconitase B